MYGTETSIFALKCLVEEVTNSEDPSNDLKKLTREVMTALINCSTPLSISLTQRCSAIVLSSLRLQKKGSLLRALSMMRKQSLPSRVSASLLSQTLGSKQLVLQLT